MSKGNKQTKAGAQQTDTTDEDVKGKPELCSVRGRKVRGGNRRQQESV